MPTTEPYRLTIAEAGTLIREKRLSPVELVRSVLERAAQTEERVHAYAHIAPESALADAASAEQEIMKGNWNGPLHGIPVNLKDTFYTRRMPTEAGSKVLQGFMPPHDSSVAERLSTAGAILLGKSVTHEFAYGAHIVKTRNPWNLECFPGGSSAGAAVSVAVDSAMGSVGGDAGGSVRMPGALNGIAAIKPTFGRISTRGMISNCTIVDTVGVLTKTVRDNALMLNALAGYDAQEATSLDVPVPDFTESLDKGIKGLRLGINQDYFLHPAIVPPIRAAFDEAVKVLRALGATIVEVDIPFVRHAITMFLTITMVSGSHVHRRQLREHGDKYQPGTRLMLQAGQLIPAADYLQALKLRQRLKDAMRDTFRMHDLDAFISPTTSTTTSPLAAHAERMTYHAGEAGLADKARQTVPFNMTGQPALSIPCGFTDERLTIGLQIAGRPCDEVNVYRIAQAYENATEWHLESPPI